MNNPFPLPKEVLLNRLYRYLEDDMAFGDISTGLIPADHIHSAKIIAKSSGIIAGAEETQLLFESQKISIEFLKNDGDSIEKGEILCKISGNLRSILMIERTSLNFLMRLSSIASSTNNLLDIMRKVNSKVRLAATRKTTPGFGWFEKKAVHYGGGDTHRWNLSDMAMFKDTHLKFFNRDIAKLLHTAKDQLSFSKKIEIEIENPDDLIPAIENGADIIMLDNMTPEIISKTIKNAQEVLGSKCDHLYFEASGNITPENIIAYSKSGVNIISTSQIILHPHIPMDYSLRLD